MISRLLSGREWALVKGQKRLRVRGSGLFSLRIAEARRRGQLFYVAILPPS
jgi:hypothetical protein